MTGMPSGAQPEPGPFARALSKEIRRLLADRQVSGAQIAARIGRSQSYVSLRLRGLSAFTINDVEDVCRVLQVDLLRVVAAAVHSSQRHP